MAHTSIRSVALAALLCAACASSKPKPVVRYVEQVDAATAAVSEGNFQGAVEAADAVLREADARSPEGAADFFRAALVAANAHLSAARATPFLTEPGPSGAEVPSKVAHWVAATRCYAGARAVAVRAATRDNADEIGAALSEANLVELSLHSRLGLTSSVNAFLARHPSLHDADACVAAARDASLNGARPWVYLALFDFQRSRDERQAYRFAILTIDEAPTAADKLDPRRLAELERWILRDSSLEFHCPKCDLVVSPALHACPSDRTPNLDFVGRKRL